MGEGIIVVLIIAVTFLLAEWYSRSQDNNDDRFGGD